MSVTTSFMPELKIVTSGRSIIGVGVLVLVIGITCYLTFDPAVSFRAFDSAAYFDYGRSIGRGDGYVNSWRPERSPATNFPVGYPVLIAGILAIKNDPLAVKWVNSFLFGLSILLVWFWHRRLRLRPALSVMIVLAGLWNGPLLFYSSQMMTEIPFLLLTVTTFYLLSMIDEKKAVPWIIPFLLSAACLIRSAGVALLISVLVVFLWKRQWRWILAVLGVYFLTQLLVTAFTQQAGTSGYLRDFLLVDPFDPSKGNIGLTSLLERIVNQVKTYGSQIIPDTILPYFSRILLPTWVRLGIGFTLCLTALVGILRLPGQKGYLAAFLVVYSMMVLVWPSQSVDDRFFVPIVPLFLMVLIVGAEGVFKRINPALLITSAAGVLFAGLLLVVVRRLSPGSVWTLDLVFAVSAGSIFVVIGYVLTKHTLRSSWGSGIVLALLALYPVYVSTGLFEVRRQVMRSETGQAGYVELARWSKTHLRQGAVFAAAYPHFYHLYSEQKSVPLFFIPDWYIGERPSRDRMNMDAAIPLMDRQGVDYVLVDGISPVARFQMDPVIDRYRDRFEIVKRSGDGTAVMYWFKRKE